MKKIIMIGALMTGLMASDNADYFGINAGNAEFEASNSSSSAKVDGTQVSATLGHYYGDTSRISATYTYVKHDVGVSKSDMFSLAYDFMLPLAKDTFYLYAGPVVGYTRYEEPGLDLSGFHFGAQAGAILRVVDNIEIEAGYRYLIENGSDAGVNLDNAKVWYVGANLRF